MSMEPKQELAIICKKKLRLLKVQTQEYFGQTPELAIYLIVPFHFCDQQSLIGGFSWFISKW